MTDRPRRPDYSYAIYLSPAMATLAILDYDKRNTSSSLFYFSLALFFAAAGILFFFIARYNKRNPTYPIRWWMRQCCGAALSFLVGAYNMFAGANGFSYFLFFLMSAFLAASGGYYFVKDPLRTSDRDIG